MTGRAARRRAQATTLGDLTKSWFCGPSLDFMVVFPGPSDARRHDGRNADDEGNRLARGSSSDRTLHGAKLDLPIYALATQLARQRHGRSRGLLSRCDRWLGGGPNRFDSPWLARRGETRCVYGAPDKLTHIESLMGHDGHLALASGLLSVASFEFVQRAIYGGISYPGCTDARSGRAATKRSVF